MSRIRSVHPGLFTDEAFIGLSADAQVFLIGLWTEADDQGVFEWKPMVLRLRLRGTKDGDVSGLLSELVAAQCITQYEVEGRKYGAVRNFRKFQRPKFPNAIHPTTDHIRIYVGLSKAITVIGTVEDAAVTEIADHHTEAIPPIAETMPDDAPPIPRNEEINLQMEDGGGREGEGRKRNARDARLVAFEGEFEATFWPAYPDHAGKKPAKGAFCKARMRASLDEIMAGLERYKQKLAAPNPPATKMAQGWLNDDRWTDGATPTISTQAVSLDGPTEQWRRRVKSWLEKGLWLANWGDLPTSGQCEAWRDCPELRDEFADQLLEIPEFMRRQA